MFWAYNDDFSFKIHTLLQPIFTWCTKKMGIQNVKMATTAHVLYCRQNEPYRTEKKFTNQIFWPPKKEKCLGKKIIFRLKMSVKTLWALDELNRSEKNLCKYQWIFFRCKRVKWHLCVLGSAFVFTHHTWWPLSIYNLGCVLFLNLNQTRGHFFTSFSPLTYQNNLFSFKPFFTVPIVRCPIALVGFVFLPILAFILFWSLPTHQTYRIE